MHNKNSFSPDSLSRPSILCLSCLDPQPLPGGPYGCSRRLCTVCEVYNALASKPIVSDLSFDSNFDVGVYSHTLECLHNDLCRFYEKVPMLDKVAQQTNYHSIDNLSIIKMRFKSIFDLYGTLNSAIYLPNPEPKVLIKGLEALSIGKLDISVRMEEFMTGLIAHEQNLTDSECLTRTQCVIPNR